jgi:hypothetical protein
LYTVFVTENSAYHDEEAAPRTAGTFVAWDDALAMARQLVERSLEEVLDPAADAETLFRRYTTFGEEPYIVPNHETQPFSAWEYARERCRQLGRPAGEEPFSDGTA